MHRAPPSPRSPGTNIRSEAFLQEERLRIARDLHDTLLQRILSLSMQLQVAFEKPGVGEQAKSAFNCVLQLMGEVVEEARSAVLGLRTPRTEGRELEDLLANVPRDTGVGAPQALQLMVRGARQALRPVVREEIYRIGREALLNAFRHSTAKKIEIELTYGVRHFRVRVRDDGCGMDPHVVQFGRAGHYGVPGMRERAGRIGAILRVRSELGVGTEVELGVPGEVAFESL